MKKARIRLTKGIITSRTEAESTLGEIASATAELNLLSSEMDALLTEVRQRYEGTIEAHKKTIELKSGALKAWADQSPEEFGDRKSIDFLHGRIGFRTGNPRLKTVAGWTWDRVKSVVEKVWVRVKEEVDKEGLLGAYARGEMTDVDLRKVGVQVVQEESFFIEPKIEERSAAITAKAS